VSRAILWLISTALSAQSILIKNVTLIDMTGAAERKGVSVAIDGERIGAIAKKIRKPRNAVVINGKGKFLIPGLWDMHAHITSPEIYFPLLVANGITGVREMFDGIPMPVIRQWRTRADVPRIVAPGFIDGPPMLWNGAPPPGAIAVETADQARFAVDTLARSGVDFIKTYNAIPRDAYFALAAEARAIGIPFAGHVPEAVSPLEASEAGERSEEHLINILLACSTEEEALRAERVREMLDRSIAPEQRLRILAFPDAEELDKTYSAEKAAILFRTFVKNGTWQTPTLALLDGFARAKDEDFVHDPRRKYLPAAWSDNWDPKLSFYLKDLSAEQYAALNAKIRTLLARYQKLVGEMHRAGVEFLAGTDANGWNPVYPGFGLHRELTLLVESGLTPMEALQAATRNAAMYFGSLQTLGTIEAGKAADVVLLNADPLKEIRNTEKIDAVIMRGRYFSRAELDKMLERAAQAARPH
jgi:imidazolonepropionase-like amidohydrolase